MFVFNGEVIGDDYCDIKYFIEKYLIEGSLRLVQSEMLAKWVNDKFCVDMVPRQSGLSTLMAAYAAYTMYVANKEFIVVSNVSPGIAADFLSTVTVFLGRISAIDGNFHVTSQNSNEVAVLGYDVSGKILEKQNTLRVATHHSMMRGRGLAPTLLLVDSPSTLIDCEFEEMMCGVGSLAITSRRGVIIAGHRGTKGNCFFRLWESADSGAVRMTASSYPYAVYSPMSKGMECYLLLSLGDEDFQAYYGGV